MSLYVTQTKNGFKISKEFDAFEELNQEISWLSFGDLKELKELISHEIQRFEKEIIPPEEIHSESCSCCASVQT